MENRIHNFNAGPSVLPEEVLREVQANLLSYKGYGLSVMEMSHRSAEYQQIIDGATDAVKRIYNLGDDYDVLFLQGGASTQFLMLAVNLIADGKEGNYVNTGTWATKALQEAKKIGKGMHIAASSKEGAFSYIPRDVKLSENPAFLHITTNNTIRGTEYCFTPDVPAGIPLVADMSSNFMSRPYDISKYDLIYAGAQKNVGPAGCTVVIIKKTLAEKFNKDLPTMLDYNTHISKGSMFNTPPAFNIYVIGEVLKWIENFGSLEKLHEYNVAKANYIYDTIDNSNGFYKGAVTVKEDRSLMNITFRLPTEELEAKFIAEAKVNNMIGLKGHRSVGGCRASVYNSCPVASAQALAEFMVKFQKENQ
ncbi:MAG: phosphoserine transaminase [Candidatus Cloacimonetes bacterium 4572_65]|nr:MAG: phosphoserine transaminase [Candidatus Cloacimonetes bacterium 4572_65]